MFLDLSIISPIRETSSDLGAKRRRREREKTQKVLPRRPNQGPLDGEEASRQRGKALNAYA
jgi:hypothetical protein